MELNGMKTVREIALEMPAATRVFEKMGIDYCCGGARPIREACQTAGVTFEELSLTLEQAESWAQDGAAGKDWQAETLALLITHIHDRHHVFTRDELARIEPLLAKVSSVYGDRRPELVQIQALFEELSRELLFHMKKEENILFPYVVAMEDAVRAGLAVPPSMFGTVRNPVRMMMTEHDGAGDLLRRIRQLSDDFTPPDEACVSYRTLYGALEGLEKDLHQHIHLENNILFPRAVAMEG